MDAPAPVSEELAGNAEATAAWDGPLFDRFVEFREIVTTGLGAHGDAAIEVLDPQPGERVLDIGCGFGDATQQLAQLVGSGGEAVGVDVSPRFIETSVHEAAQAAWATRASRSSTWKSTISAGRYRPRLLALRDDVLRGARPRAAQRPRLAEARRTTGDGRVAPADRQRLDVPRADDRGGDREPPEEYDEPTCGPGPFSMADADTTSEILSTRASATSPCSAATCRS